MGNLFAKFQPVATNFFKTVREKFEVTDRQTDGHLPCFSQEDEKIESNIKRL